MVIKYLILFNTNTSKVIQYQHSTADICMQYSLALSSDQEA